MAKLSKDDFQKLWDEFQDDPAEVGGNPRASAYEKGVMKERRESRERSQKERL